jgi:hypothetical protein
MATICFVDIKKGREDCREFTEQRKMDRVVAESGYHWDLVHSPPRRGPSCAAR